MRSEMTTVPTQCSGGRVEPGDGRGSGGAGGDAGSRGLWRR